MLCNISIWNMGEEKEDDDWHLLPVDNVDCLIECDFNFSSSFFIVLFEWLFYFF